MWDAVSNEKDQRKHLMNYNNFWIGFLVGLLVGCGYLYQMWYMWMQDRKQLLRIMEGKVAAGVFQKKGR